jgi:hypothetical protein
MTPAELDRLDAAIKNVQDGFVHLLYGDACAISAALRAQPSAEHPYPNDPHPGCVFCMKAGTSVLPGKYCPECGWLRAQASAEQAHAAVDLQLSRVLHEMAGSVSLCWIPKPSGEFDTSTAIEFVSNAIAELRSIYDAALVPPAPVVPDDGLLTDIDDVLTSPDVQLFHALAVLRSARDRIAALTAHYLAACQLAKDTDARQR